MKEVKQAEALRLADEVQKSADYDVTTGMPITAWQFQLNVAAELRRQHARIAELEAELEAVGAGGVQSLRKQAAAPQAVQADVPLPLLLRDIARDLGITVPEACNALKPLGNYSTNSAVTAEMARMLRDHFPAPAHPAYGVPEQAAEVKIGQLLALARIMVRAALDADNKTEMQEIKAAIDSEVQFERALRNTFAATHPTQQGLDAQRWRIVHNHISGEYIAGRACFVVHVQPMSGANIMRGSVAEHFTKAVDDIAAQIKIAAQAKQGGA
jgi:hypothetical protein